MTYPTMSSDRVEKVLHTTKDAANRTVDCKPSDWDLAVPRIQYGYRRHGLVSGFCTSS